MPRMIQDGVTVEVSLARLQKLETLEARVPELERAIAELATETAITRAKIECDCSAQNIAQHLSHIYVWLNEWGGYKVVDKFSQPMMHANFGASGPDGARTFIHTWGKPPHPAFAVPDPDTLAAAETRPCETSIEENDD